MLHFTLRLCPTSSDRTVRGRSRRPSRPISSWPCRCRSPRSRSSCVAWPKSRQLPHLSRRERRTPNVLLAHSHETDESTDGALWGQALARDAAACLDPNSRKLHTTSLSAFVPSEADTKAGHQLMGREVPRQADDADGTGLDLSQAYHRGGERQRGDSQRYGSMLCRMPGGRTHCLVCTGYYEGRQSDHRQSAVCSERGGDRGGSGVSLL